MSRRLYFVLPDVETAVQVEEELLLAKVEEKRMHFLARRGTDMRDLPQAGPAQKTDLLRGIYIGLLSGAITGLLAGTYLYFSPETVGMQVPPYVIFVCAFVGAIIGAWISGPLIGASTPNAKLSAYQDCLDAGRVLLIIDVAHRRVEEIRSILRKHHPDSEAVAGIPAYQ